MMGIQPLNDDIVQLWNEPEVLVEQWASGEHRLKCEHERLVADWIRPGIDTTVADLGCGVGRLIGPMNPAPEGYWGFDSSLAMVLQASADHPGYTFSVVNIFEYSSDRQHDVVVMLDVAQHQDQPLDSILQVTQLWTAKRYIVSLLVGDAEEVLSMSVVLPLTSLLGLLDRVTLNCMHMERCGEEQFAWVLLDISRL